MTRLALAAVLALAVAPVPCRAQELGRLFFSPAERATLDAQRRDLAGRAARAAMPLQVDGYAMRSGGKPRIWINGALAEGALQDGGRLAPAAGHPGELVVTGSARRSGTKVKVGGTLDPVSGEARDVIGGRLRARR